MSDGKKGKDSGVTAEDFARARDVGKVEPTPGKTTGLPSVEVGDHWIDQGSACDGKDSKTPGCFLTDWQRLKLVVKLKLLIEKAVTNYKLALVELKFEELMKKADDIPWVLTLALELVGAHFIKVIGKAAVALKGSGLNKLASSMKDVYLSDRSWQTRAEAVLGSLDGKAIETYVKTTLDPLKKSGVTGVKAALGEQAKTEQRGDIAYIDHLKNQCDVEFQAFSDETAAHATDAQLIVIYDGMDASNHSVGAYKAALGEKLERFRKSGASEIGRHLTVRDRLPYGTRVRDKRLVWYQENGKRTLRYQTQDSAFLTQRLEPPRSMDGSRAEFGPRYADPVQLGEIVPDEFVDVALARSEQLWGPTPLVLGKSSSSLQPAPTAPVTRVPTQLPARPPSPEPTKTVEPNMDALPDAFRQVPVK
jgi:hypothetical protein